jgi:hypothetical protein
MAVVAENLRWGDPLFLGSNLASTVAVCHKGMLVRLFVCG